MTDPSPDIYAMLDKAGLTAGDLLSTRKPMAKIVTEIRVSIVKQVGVYLKEVSGDP